MSAARKNGYAFVLEGDTEKEFYLAFLEHLCKKHSARLNRIEDKDTPDISYSLVTQSNEAIIKFHVVGAIAQVPRAADWVKTQCIKRFKPRRNWYVFLCYDTDDYKPRISKFYEGDWKLLRDSLENICKVMDAAAAADIEDVMLVDIKDICAFLGCEIPDDLKGAKGKAKIKNLFRDNGSIYQEGERARPLIDNLDMEVIMEANVIPLKEIEQTIFK